MASILLLVVDLDILGVDDVVNIFCCCIFFYNRPSAFTRFYILPFVLWILLRHNFNLSGKKTDQNGFGLHGADWAFLNITIGHCRKTRTLIPSPQQEFNSMPSIVRLLLRSQMKPASGCGIFWLCWRPIGACFCSLVGSPFPFSTSGVKNEWFA